MRLKSASNRDNFAHDVALSLCVGSIMPNCTLNLIWLLFQTSLRIVYKSRQFYSSSHLKRSITTGVVPCDSRYTFSVNSCSIVVLSPLPATRATIVGL